KLGQVDIERAHRVERRKSGGINQHQADAKPRVIVCRLSSWKQKEAVVRKARKEKPEGLFICEDLSQATLEKRKPHLEKLKAAKQAGKSAYFILDQDFRLAIFEQLNGPIRYDPIRLASLRFNPLLSETYKKFSLSSHHDPDANFFTELVDCEYYTEENFNEMLHQKNILEVNNCLSLLHLNIRSLHRNLDSLTTLLKNLEFRFSVIGITETWPRDSSHHTSISGYN
ncbi:unnamed protein product, partial [Porites lobata]